MRVASFSPKITESPEYIKAPCKATSQSQLAWKSCACGESQEATEAIGVGRYSHRARPLPSSSLKLEPQPQEDKVSKARFQDCKTELEARAKQVGREARSHES